MDSCLPTPEQRREQVSALVRDCPERERGLLRARLFNETPSLVGSACSATFKVRCAVCWAPRPLHLQLGEVKERQVVTCRHPLCERLWRKARAKERSLQERAKAALLDAFARGEGACHA